MPLRDRVCQDVVVIHSKVQWQQEFSALIRLSWPLIVANLAQIALTTTDVVIMGRYGAETLACGSLGANLYISFFVVGMGMASATAPLFAQAMGRRYRTHKSLRLILHQGLIATLVYSLLTWALLSQTEALLTLIGEPPELAKGAATYISTLKWGLLPALWFVVLRCFVSALQRPKSALIATGMAIVINAIACWALMFGRLGAPPLGLAGAGYASTLANATMALTLTGILLFDRTFQRFPVFTGLFQWDQSCLLTLLRLGLPMSVAAGFEISVFSIAAMAMGLIGPDSVAAHAVAIQVASITFMVPLGVGQAATIRVGLGFGAQDDGAVRRAGWSAVTLGVGFMAVIACVLLSVPQTVVGLFLDLSDPTTQRATGLAVSFLTIVAFFQVFDGAQCVCSGVLRGLNDTRVPMIIAGIGYWCIGLPLGLYLAFLTHLDGAGLWIGLAVGLGSVAVMMMGRWIAHPALSKRPLGTITA